MKTTASVGNPVLCTISMGLETDGEHEKFNKSTIYKIQNIGYASQKAFFAVE